MSDTQPEYPDANFSKDINVLAIVKGAERYIFLFTDEYRAECLRTLGRYASNPELSFTWYDAAVLSQKIRKIVPAEQKPALQSPPSSPSFGIESQLGAHNFPSPSLPPEPPPVEIPKAPTPALNPSTEISHATRRDINVLALVKGEERYIYLFDDDNRAAALRKLGQHASNPDLSFTWYDAAVLSQKIRKMSPASPSAQSRFTLPAPTNDIPAAGDEAQDRLADAAARRSRIKMPGFRPPQ